MYRQVYIICIDEVYILFQKVKNKSMLENIPYISQEGIGCDRVEI